MKKILFLIDSLGGGGAERALVNLVEVLDKTKYDITVKTIYDKGIYKEKLSENVKYKTIGLPIIRGMNYILKFIPAKILHKMWIKDKYDIEVAFLEGISTKVISAANKETKKFAWIRIDMAKYNQYKACYLTKKDMIKSYRNMDKIAFVGEDSKKSFEEIVGIKENLFVVRNIVKIDEMINKSKENVEICIDKKPILLSIGRLEFQKGYDRLCNIHKKLIAEGLYHTTIIIGEGSQKSEIEKFIKENKLQNTLKIIDFQENPFKYIRVCDWFVSSSRFEGFSSVIREATILGKPIIATECSGVKEVLGNSEYGIVVENSEEELYKAIKKVLLDKNLKEYYKDMIERRKVIFNYSETVNTNMKFLDLD